jgi:hypothetical protein
MDERTIVPILSNFRHFSMLLQFILKQKVATKKKRQNLIRLFSCKRGIRNDYFLNYYEQIDFITKYLQHL